MAAAFPRYNYIISKYTDPVFALFIGLSAAAVRIHREEKEKGRTGAEMWAVGLRRVGWGSEKGKGEGR
ncbi:MAG: Non-classical export 1 [Lasallia pustulata]|uniref:Non-classical export 1 n=1 Tax=Lasallia pustulata TaxID=136370 RepID=A0A5M8PKS8_9LECA|nr:MAG: Non-classical export 1 [Lasallia pustulata]